MHNSEFLRKWAEKQEIAHLHKQNFIFYGTCICAWKPWEVGHWAYACQTFYRLHGQTHRISREIPSFKSAFMINGQLFTDIQRAQWHTNKGTCTCTCRIYWLRASAVCDTCTDVISSALLASAGCCVFTSWAQVQRYLAAWDSFIPIKAIKNIAYAQGVFFTSTLFQFEDSWKFCFKILDVRVT